MNLGGHSGEREADCPLNREHDGWAQCQGLGSCPEPSADA